MTQLTDMALAGLQRDRTQRSRITIPEWSTYKDCAAVLQARLPEAEPERTRALEEWAKACEVQPEVVQVIVNGDVLMPKIAILRKLADHLGIALTELVEPFEAWYSQITMAESRKIQGWAEGDEHQAMLHTIRLKLEDEAGRNIFTLEHMEALKAAPAVLIATVAQQITQRPSLKDQVKNS